MLQRLRSSIKNSVSGLHGLPFSTRAFFLFAMCLCLPVPAAWSQGLQPATTISQFSQTLITGSTQQNIQLKITGSPISITSFSFANSQGGVAEFVAGTATGCVVDGSTMNAVGTVCTVPVTFQPAYPGPRLVPLKAVTSGGTFYFGLDGIGLAAQVSLTPGTMSTVAGTGVSGNTGNNGAATSATLSHPARTAVDYQGNVFLADASNNVIREIVASTGNIVLVAGTGTACATPLAACGDGGLATNANLLNPSSVAVDATGNLFIADSGDNRVRRVDATTGVITTVAGNGIAAYAGDGGQATAASMGNPQQVVVDYSGNLYIAAAGDDAVRFVSVSSGVITTLAGDGTICSPSTAACGDGGTAGGGSSKLNAPSGLALDSLGNLYVADTGDNRVRRIDTSGNISTVAGTGTAGYTGDGAAATSAELNGAIGIDVDAAGDLYISDTGNSSIRLVLSYTGTIATIAGNGTACASATAVCGDGGGSTGANLISPQSAALDSLGDLYIADSGGNRIRLVQVTEPTLNFAPVTAGSYSPSDPLSILVTNIGNQVVTATVPATGTNPSFTGNYFVYDSEFSVCPLLTPASSPQPLPPGYGCTYAIDFQARMAGVTMGSMTLSGNGPISTPTETVLLIGNGLQIVEGNTLTSSDTNPTYGEQVTFTDTVMRVNGVNPSGTVSFYNGTTLIGAIPITYLGIATLTIDSLPAGTDNITAVYSGDVNFASSTSAILVETVGNLGTVATTTTLTSSVNPSNYGQTTNLAATVGYPMSDPVPTGSVTFYSPGASTTINLQANPASTTLSQTLNLAAGTYSVAVLGNSGGGLYAGWNSASNPGTNNLWTDRYGIELCTSCTALVNDIAGDPGYATDVAALAAFQAAKSLNLTVDVTEQGQAVGNPYTFTLTAPQSVSFYIPDGTFVNGAFTDTSSFADDSGGLSLLLTPLTAVGTATVNASGVATLSTSTLPIGSDVIQAVFSGDNTYVGSSSAILTQTVNKAAENGMLTTSNAAPVVGQPVTFTDTFAAVNSIYPSGTIAFYNGTISIGTGPLTNGVATLMTSALPPGTDTITAVYGGDANFQPATSNAIVETVSKAMGPDTLTASTYSANLGQAVTFTNTIQKVNGITPTGTVSFYNGSALLGAQSLNASGVATVTTASLPAGTDAIKGVYSGDGDYDPATSNVVTVIVAKGSATNTLTASTATSTVGQAVMFSATLSGVAGFTPTGMVTFYNGTTAIGTGAVSASGVATLTTSSLPVGNDSVTAAYGGDTNYPAATSNAVVEIVSKAMGPDTLTASSYSPNLGQAVTFTDKIQTVDSIPPTGTVSFYNGSSLIGTGSLNSSGVATITTAMLPAGSNTITSVYSGDGDYDAANSNAVTVIVAKGSVTNTLTASTATSVVGQAVTFTATLAGVAGFTPTGTVIFYNGAMAIGMGPVNASGVATLTTTALPVGSDSITAVYGGDSNYQTATSNAVVETVSKATGPDTLTASNYSATLGQAVTLTDTIQTVDGITPTGTVSFYNGSTLLGAGPLNGSGMATLTTSLPPGSDVITAVYGGDSDYASESSNAVTVNVAKGSATNTLTASTTSTIFGQPVTFTAMLAGVAGYTPTGTVTFYNGTTALGMGTVSASGVATLTTTALPVGTDSVTAVYGGDTNYTVSTSGAVTVVVAPLLVSTVDVLTASTTASVFGESVMFTDNITGSRGAPTGTVTFYDGTVAIGTAMVGAGVATFSTTKLSVGSHSITAVYSGDSNYLTDTSNAVTVTVGDGDFTISVSPSYQTINNGQSAIYMVSLAGSGAPFDESVTLSATGLPPGASVSFNPASVIPGAGPTTVTMTVATSSTQTSLIHTGHIGKIGYAVLLLPLLGWRRFRSRLRRSSLLALFLLAAVAGLGGATLLTGCGGGTFTENYTITVTGTAGANGNIQHATVVRLGVQSLGE